MAQADLKSNHHACSVGNFCKASRYCIAGPGKRAHTGNSSQIYAAPNDRDCLQTMLISRHYTLQVHLRCYNKMCSLCIEHCTDELHRRAAQATPLVTMLPISGVAWQAGLCNVCTPYRKIGPPTPSPHPHNPCTMYSRQSVYAFRACAAVALACQV